MAYHEKFEPIAAVGQNLYMFAPSRPQIHGFYRVLFEEPLPTIIHDFGSIASEDDTGDVEVTALYQDEDNCAHYRVFPLDDLNLEVKQPKALTRWTTKEATTYLDQLHGQYVAAEYRHLTEVFVFEDEKIYFLCRNPTKYTQPRNRVLFIGFRYSVEKLKERPAQWAFFPVEGAKGSLVAGGPAAVTLSPTLPATVGPEAGRPSPRRVP